MLRSLFLLFSIFITYKVSYLIYNYGNINEQALEQVAGEITFMQPSASYEYILQLDGTEPFFSLPKVLLAGVSNPPKLHDIVLLTYRPQGSLDILSSIIDYEFLVWGIETPDGQTLVSTENCLTHHKGLHYWIGISLSIGATLLLSFLFLKQVFQLIKQD